MGEDKASPKLWAIVIIAVAAIGCIGTILAAAIGVLPDFLTPEPLYTLVPQVNTPVDYPGELEATRTAIAQPLPAPAVIVRADDVIPQIRGEDGEIQRVLSWWREDDNGGSDGQLNPLSLRPDEKCFGMAWNTNEYGYHRLIVFQKPTMFTFADGGWYVKVCIPNDITISPEDIGKIQADWMSKRYGIDNQPWEVIVN